MKKTYQTPAIGSSVGYLNPLCQIGIVGSTDATEGNLSKQREEEEKEDEAIIQLLKDREEGNTSPLW